VWWVLLGPLSDLRMAFGYGESISGLICRGKLLAWR
jgi:hypothetical protein